MLAANKTLLAATKAWGGPECERILVDKSMKCTRLPIVNRQM